MFHPEAGPEAVKTWIKRLDAKDQAALKAQLPTLAPAREGLLLGFLSCLP
jgi:hypothetical protein